MSTHLRNALALLALTGCGGMAIDGQVVDAGGVPVAGARVAAIGSTCVAISDEQGKFEFTCPPDTFDLVISSEGFTDQEIQVEATERKRYDIGKQVLIKIPEQKGLFLFASDAYRPMKPGQLNRTLTKQGGFTTRSFCLDREHSEVNEISSGQHKLFDYEHVGWRPFRLDDQGCAYRDKKNKQQRWTVEYREKAEYSTFQVNEGKTIVTIQLDPGDYFIADWKGFFMPIKDDDKTRNSYSGAYLHVE